MNKSFAIFFFTAIILPGSCNYKAVPVKEMDGGRFYQFVSSSPKKRSGMRLLICLQNKNLLLKPVTKTVVLLLRNCFFSKSCTWKNKDRGLENPNALVVCNMDVVAFISTSPVKPDAITGQWLVLLKLNPAKPLCI